MAASSADIGYNATFGIHNGTTYDLVAEVTAINPPGYSRDSEEVTHLTSDNQYKEFIAAMKEMTSCSFTLNFIPSASDAIVTAFEADTGQFQITAPNAVTMTFSGFVTAYQIGEMTPGGKMTAEVTIQPTGKATLA